jgi:hypothetical protein
LIAAQYGSDFGLVPNSGAYNAVPDNDCTNFISQCLIQGNCDLTASPTLPSLWYKTGHPCGKTTIQLAQGLYCWITNYQGQQGHGTQLIEISGGYDVTKIPATLSMGDVISLGYVNDPNHSLYSHSMIVVDIAKSSSGTITEVYVAQHTSNLSHRPLSEAWPNLSNVKIRFLQHHN